VLVSWILIFACEKILVLVYSEVVALCGTDGGLAKVDSGFDYASLL
jgi:hypothetical protein